MDWLIVTKPKRLNIDKDKKAAGKPVLVTARYAITQEMLRRGACRASAVSADLGLKETTVSSVMYGLYVRGYAARIDRGVYELVSLPEGFTPTEGKLDVKKIRRPMGPTMPAQVIALLQAAPDHILPFEFIRSNTNFSRQATGAVLSELLTRGILERLKRGVYKLAHTPPTQNDRKEAVLRYVADRPWSRAAEIQRGSNVPVAQDTVRKILADAVKAGDVKRDGFCYAVSKEKRSPQTCRNARKALQAPEETGPRRVGRPPKSRMAVLSALRVFTQPRSLETLADCAGLSVGAVRSVLMNMVSEGLVIASKLRTDREDMRLVYHYELARDEKGCEVKKPKPKRRKRK